MKILAALSILMVIAVAAPAAQRTVAQQPIAPPSALYADLLPLFRAFHPDLSNFVILERKSISRAYSLLLVYATVPLIDQVQPRVDEDFRQESFGLFVIDTASGRLYMAID